MNPYLSQLLIRSTAKYSKHHGRKETEKERQIRERLIDYKRQVKDFFLIALGVFSAAFGFKGFLLTNHFIDGGSTGISLLIAQLTRFELYQLIIIVNIPFIYMAYKMVGKSFALKTSIAIVALSIILALIEFPNITDDNLLVAIFGGFFLGAGIGLAVRGGAVIDGTEVLAIYLSKKLGTTIGDIIIIINVLIFSAAAYLLSIEIALYSMITYLAASKTLDFVIEGIEEYNGITIISDNNDEIKDMIINKLGRGVTVYAGKGGFGKKGENESKDILYTVVTRLELSKLNTELEKIDPEAFITISRIKNIKGGKVKKRPLH